MDNYVFQNKKAGEECGTVLHYFVHFTKVLPNIRLPASFSLCDMLWLKYMEKNPG